MTKHDPIVKNYPHLLHGGDYNPEQWIDMPEVWDEDMRLLKQANCNIVSVGIFSWSMLEPEDGKYTFDWLDRIMEKLLKNQTRVCLATPGGGKPAWMAQKYPEVLRVDGERRRQRWGGRHNHCMTSPVFRRKCQEINSRLAERYKSHPMLSMWHVNNEYSGECHCDLCQNAFREWLKAKYDNDLGKLNRAYWSNFWSHNYTEWNQIESPSRIGEYRVHALNLDWKRYNTDQTISCFRGESEPLRKITPNIPVTTNMIGGYAGLDYCKIARACDFVSWDSYPAYHDRPDEWVAASVVGFLHDQRRSMLNKPFILMECAPGKQNYKPVCKMKRPGVHQLEGLQAIAHGSDSVMYFQWRKSRGSVEKFHGAVVDHHGGEKTYVFKEVAGLGAQMQKLDAVVGTETRSDVAVIYDYENRWAIDDAAGPRNPDKHYFDTCIEHYRTFWKMGINCDVIDSVADFSKYKLLIAPMLYMLRPGVAEKIDKFVASGGTFVMTYFSGIVDETDLCFTTGFPGPLRKLMGIWVEDIDALYDDETVKIVASEGNDLGIKGEYAARQFCDLVHLEGAKALATYGSEFYAGTPSVTVNQAGKGRAYYIASRNDAQFNLDFFGSLCDQLSINRAITGKLPLGITATVRTDGNNEFVFLMSFVRQSHKLDLGDESLTDAITGEVIDKTIDLPGYGSRVLVRKIN